MDKLEAEFKHLLDSQKIDPRFLDYSILDRHIVMLEQLAKATNSGITVFDHYKQKHVFTSDNFPNLFGYEVDKIEQEDTHYFKAKVHPDDIEPIMRNGLTVLKFFLNGDGEDFIHTKMISEYRIIIPGKYIRVIEQFKVLEFDKLGNVWLTLSVLDISPNQSPLDFVHSKLMNCNTGNVYILPEFSGLAEPVILSEREKTVLQLVRDGKLSKEISDQLEISIFTVNTHRQRILKKLNANNTAEAILYASRLGLIS
jgi:DNA-binding CsgD family transcriptional regulator